MEEEPLTVSTFQKQLIGIPLVALIMTCFEVFFFYKIVAPKIGQQIRNALRHLSKQLADNYPTTSVPPTFINSLVDEESTLVQKINKSIIIDSLVISVPLLFVLGGLYVNLKSNNESFMDKSSLFMIGLSATFFMLFQIYFFCNISFNYQYPSQAEIQDTMLKSLINAVDEKLAK